MATRKVLPFQRLTLVGVIAVLLLACTSGEDRPDDARELLGMHRQILEAHKQNNVELWNSLESDTITVASRGRLMEVSLSDRIPGRRSYLRSTRFEIYKDLRPPIIKVSNDGSLGWLFAQVEVKGERDIDGKIVQFHDVWAWVELYEKRGGKWFGTGNASNVYSVAENSFPQTGSVSHSCIGTPPKQSHLKQSPVRF